MLIFETVNCVNYYVLLSKTEQILEIL